MERVFIPHQVDMIDEYVECLHNKQLFKASLARVRGYITLMTATSFFSVTKLIHYIVYIWKVTK
jgi:hypothetical protein